MRGLGGLHCGPRAGRRGQGSGGTGLAEKRLLRSRRRSRICRLSGRQQRRRWGWGRPATASGWKFPPLWDRKGSAGWCGPAAAPVPAPGCPSLPAEPVPRAPAPAPGDQEGVGHAPQAGLGSYGGGDQVPVPCPGPAAGIRKRLRGGPARSWERYGARVLRCRWCSRLTPVSMLCAQDSLLVGSEDPRRRGGSSLCQAGVLPAVLSLLTASPKKARKQTHD